MSSSVITGTGIHFGRLHKFGRYKNDYMIFPIARNKDLSPVSNN